MEDEVTELNRETLAPWVVAQLSALHDKLEQASQTEATQIIALLSSSPYEFTGTLEKLREHHFQTTYPDSDFESEFESAPVTPVKSNVKKEIQKIIRHIEWVLLLETEEKVSLDLNPFEVASVILARLYLLADENSYSKRSLETIFGLLITNEKVDVSCALSMLKTRFVDVGETSKELTLAASLFDVLQQPKVATKWGISTDNKLISLETEATDAEEIALSQYENSIIRMNREIPMFWANIEIHKGAGPQHTHVYALSLLTKPLAESISILEKRTQINQTLVKILSELVNQPLKA
jgi:hypothetical protein